MKKFYEKPITSFVMLNFKDDVLNVSSGLFFKTASNAEIDENDVRPFSGFFEQ